MGDVKTAKTISMVAAATILTRILTLISVQMYLWQFGADNEKLNIYSYAATIPNVLFTCIGTALVTIVIPIYTSLLAKNELARAKKFIDDIITISTIIIFFLVLLGFFASAVLPNLTAYKNSAEHYAYAVYSLRVMFFVMFFYGLNFIFQGFLQSNNSFLGPAIVSLPSSLCIIFYTLFLSKTFGVDGLLWATLLGLSLQAIFLIPFMMKVGYKYKFSPDFKNPEILTAAKLVPPVLIAASAYQVNMLVSTSLATKFNTVTMMLSVQNIILMSTLTFVYSVTAVYYPRFAPLWEKADKTEYKKSVSEAISIIIFLIIPASAGFISLDYEIINLVSGWGNFNHDSVLKASKMLSLYAVGIVFVCIKEILDRAFFAQKDTKTSAIIGFIIMGVNIILSFAFINILGEYSMVLAYSIAAIFGGTVSLLIINKRVNGFLLDLVVLSVKCLGAAMVMTVCVKLIKSGLLAILVVSENILQKSIMLLVPTIIGATVYFAIGSILKIEQSQAIVNMLKSKILKSR